MIVVAGKNNIAVNALDFLKNSYAEEDLAFVCNKNDLGIDGWQQSAKKKAFCNNVNIISLEDAYEKADLFISLEYDRIVNPCKFRKSLNFNIHFSKLPAYKGMYTSIWPILYDEKCAGVTLHEIDYGIDTGDVVDQKIFDINENDRSRDLYEKYLRFGYQLFLDNFENLLNNNYDKKKQEKNRSSYFSKKSIDFSDLKIDLLKTAFEIKKQVYAFSFREYQLPKFNGRSIVEVDILDERSRAKPGTLLREDNNFVEVATVDYNVKLYFDKIEDIGKFGFCSESSVEANLKGFCGINDRNNFGWSPIIVAAYNGNYKVVERLLRLGADINDVNYKGTTLLMYAKDYCLKNKDNYLFDFLVSNGADLEKRDFSGKAIFDYLKLGDGKLLGL